jgi:hypothetical protein
VDRLREADRQLPVDPARVGLQDIPHHLTRSHDGNPASPEEADDMRTSIRYCVGSLERRNAARYGLRTLLAMVVPADCLIEGTMRDDARADEVVVSYGTESRCIANGVRIYQSDFFGRQFGTIAAMPPRPVARLESMPALYRDLDGEGGRLCTVHNESGGALVECHVDFVASAFFMLSRYEETIVQSVDRFGRFPAESSIAWQEGFMEVPIVNEYAAKLLDMLRSAGYEGERRTWWHGAPWAIALTHDIDTLHHFPMSPLDIARFMLGRVPDGTPGVRDLLRDYWHTRTGRKKDEYDCLPDMAAWETAHGVHASYYFLGDDHGFHGADYAVDSRAIATTMDALTGMGHEVGFHAGIDAYDDVQRFHRELSRVRRSSPSILGGRQHYLRWKTPATWRLWEQEGLAYDATLGYSRVSGFRCGTCLPFHPFDTETDREMDLWEWPLMFMDTTHLLSWSEGMRVLGYLEQQCRAYGGVLVLLWHNSHWSRVYAAAVRDSLGELVEHCVVDGVAVDSIAGLMQLAGISRSTDSNGDG